MWISHQPNLTRTNLKIHFSSDLYISDMYLWNLILFIKIPLQQLTSSPEEKAVVDVFNSSISELISSGREPELYTLTFFLNLISENRVSWLYLSFLGGSGKERHGINQDCLCVFSKCFGEMDNANRASWSTQRALKWDFPIPDSFPAFCLEILGRAFIFAFLLRPSSACSVSKLSRTSFWEQAFLPPPHYSFEILV